MKRGQVSGDVKNPPKAIRSFLESFEAKPESVPMFDKKELIRMVVEKIIVDREGKISAISKVSQTSMKSGIFRVINSG